ncbi:MAG TPA: PAS domain-containing protein [Spirochaetota bacterium]|nr:PAS domain-containing protein [Spirochaetota bacterium]
MDRFFDSDKNLNQHFKNSFEDIYSYINAIPALFWSIDVVKNRIEYLNKYALPGLGENSTLIIKNPDFTYSIILDEDRHIFEKFIKNIRERKVGLAVFRIKLYDGTIKWLKIAGNQDIYRSNYYVGYIMDITETAVFIKSIDNSDSRIIKRINLFDNPVALFVFDDKKMFACNDAFREMFAISPESLQYSFLKDYISENSLKYLDHIYEEIIFSGRWRGELTFKTMPDNDFLSDTSIRPLHVEGKNLLWVSVYNIPERRSEADYTSLPEKITDIDLKKINRDALSAAKKKDIIRLLEIILENQPIHGLANAILYSDIHVDEGKVFVWGAGEAFRTLTPGYTYPFEGTIAENILNYNLPHIIVENTFESIKPVDWAIFIPNGIKSYFAKPFYNDNKLVTVLIFCSTELSVFNEKNIGTYDSIYPVFINNLNSMKKK